VAAASPLQLWGGTTSNHCWDPLLADSNYYHLSTRVKNNSQRVEKKLHRKMNGEKFWVYNTAAKVRISKKVPGKKFGGKMEEEIDEGGSIRCHPRGSDGVRVPGTGRVGRPRDTE
jgi:hypothetical protein